MRLVLSRALLLALALAAPARADLRVAVISDLNGAYGSTHYGPSVARAVARIVALKPDLVIVTGDMVAGQRLHPLLERDALEAMWKAFHAEVTDPLAAAGIPLAVTPGNHDASDYERFSLERSIFREQWRERTQGLRFVDRADHPLHYAFAVGDALFVSLDATRIGALDPEQRRWLDALLEREAGGFRHRVVFGHLPIYPIAQGREREVMADHELERVLRRHGVELFLSGHHQAFYPGFHEGVRHVGQACLGAGPRKPIGSTRTSERALTWLELGATGVRVTALGGPGLDRPIDLATLPEAIHSSVGTLVREDLGRVGDGPAAASRP